MTPRAGRQFWHAWVVLWTLALVVACAGCGFSPKVGPTDGNVATDATNVVDVRDGTTVDGSVCGVAEVAAGGNHACARMLDGTVYCWGSNNTYELGVAQATKCLIGTTMYACSPTPLDVGITGATALGLGNSHSCSATGSGTFCWGYNKYGAFGDGTITTSATPRLIAQRAGADAIAGGVYHTCSSAAGEVECSGENVAGEVGNNTSVTQTTAVDAMAGATSLALGEYLSCAIDGSQEVWCWGDNAFDEIDTTGQNKLAPALVSGVSNALQVAAGRDHLCVVAADHTLVCKGSNSLGQLGAGTLANIDEVSANHNHTCVRDHDGAVSCFGDSYGATPVAINLPRPATAITSGPYHDCALTDDHAAWCWGDDSFGELGNGSNTEARLDTPQRVSVCP